MFSLRGSTICLKIPGGISFSYVSLSLTILSDTMENFSLISFTPELTTLKDLQGSKTATVAV